LIGRLPEATGDVVDIGGGGAGFGAHSAILTLQGWTSRGLRAPPTETHFPRP
jgi:hypothetical protein